jgi:16S rRNA (guanine966-N2)-methyltransferase
MRIIAGKYRGRRLKRPPTLETRPTSDRLRETLFNILAPRINGARFLDLCAGSGAVGIEALSRGAVHATFVDQSRRMCDLIEANLEALDVSENDAAVVSIEATEFLRRHAKKEGAPFDIIFFDPPYATDYELVLSFFGGEASRLLTADGIVVVEHHRKTDLLEAFDGLKRYRVVKQGDSCLSFYGAT